MPATTRPKVLVIHGPNLNLLGTREPEVYGSTTLPEIDARLVDHGASLGLDVETFQSNHEGAIVDRVQAAIGVCAAIIINPGAYTHTSVAILDALLAFSGPVVEVHLSNIYRREEFRHHSYISRAALGQICGLGAVGYELALTALAGRLE